MLRGIAEQASNREQKIKKLRDREIHLADCLADLIISLRKEGITSDALSEAIQDYEHLVGALEKAEKERELSRFGYEMRKKDRRKKAPA